MKQFTVLILEPDQGLSAKIKSACEADGFLVAEVRSEEEALEWLWERGSEAAAIFADLDEPRWDDSMSLASIVARDWPHIGMVMTDREGDVTANVPGRLRILSKPCMPGEILDELQLIVSAA